MTSANPHGHQEKNRISPVTMAVNSASQGEDYPANPATVMVNPASRVKDSPASPATVMINPVSQSQSSQTWASLVNRFRAAGQWLPRRQPLWLVWSRAARPGQSWLRAPPLTWSDADPTR